MPIRSQVISECDQYRQAGVPPRYFDLCAGVGLFGQRPTLEQVNAWRAGEKLEPLESLPPLRQSVSQPEWDVSQPSRGLGDMIRKVTHATGIDKAVEYVAEAVTGKKECGCKKRAEALNAAFPFKAES